MGLFDNGFKLGTRAAIGLGAIVLVPVLTPLLSAVARPLVKAGIKGGFLLIQRGKEAFSEAAEVMEDMVVEVKSELLASGYNLDDSLAHTMSEGVGEDHS
jgi:hypothetical protein